MKYEVEKKYLNTEEEKRTVHNLLVQFYDSRIIPQLQEDPCVKPPPYYAHCLQQIVFHQLAASTAENQKRDFSNTLRNVYFVRERIVYDQQDLLQVYLPQ